MSKNISELTEAQRTHRREYDRAYRLRTIDRQIALRKARQEKNKDIISADKKQYYIKNRLSILEGKKKYYKDNRGRIRATQKIYSVNNLEYMKNKNRKYRVANQVRMAANQKMYYLNNKAKILTSVKEYRNRRLKNDKLFAFKNNLSVALRYSFKKRGYIKTRRTEKILGCTIKELWLHLEKQFEPWMNWSNYGSVNGRIPKQTNQCWDVDHIIPLNTAKAENDILRLNHYSNLRPLCSYINRFVKKAKLDFKLN